MSCGVAHAFLDDAGGMRDLDALASGSGWVLNRATAINDVGLVIGDGLLNGDIHSFLLLPLDNMAPIVTAPSPITVEGTELGGARSGSALFLAAFLAARVARRIMKTPLLNGSHLKLAIRTSRVVPFFISVLRM